MGILNKINEYIEILEQEKDNILPKKDKVKAEFSFDEVMFSKMANFIINLNPDVLSDKQVEEIINMIEDLEVENIEEENNPKLAKMSSISKNQASKKWYRQNKAHIKTRKEKMERSSEGRKREKNKERLAQHGKTPTGKNKSRYHRRKRSDRDNLE